LGEFQLAKREVSGADSAVGSGSLSLKSRGGQSKAWPNAGLKETTEIS